MDRKVLRRLWERRVAAFERSGQRRRAWCAAHGVSVHSLDAWRYRLRGERRSASRGARARRSQSRALVPILVRESPATVADGAAGAIELVLARGLRLSVPAGTDVRWLAGLVRELGGC
ncbi:MAG: IS66 family insertion sequence element accessory protein TnpA [Luteimonas sp.]